MQWTSAPNIGEAPLPQRARSYWRTRFSAAAGELEKLLEAERAQLPPWLVVGFGSGIAAWFALDDTRQWQAFLCTGGALALAGFAIAVASLGLTSSVNARLLIVLLGLAVSLFGIIGVINKAYLKNAIWRKQS